MLVQWSGKVCLRLAVGRDLRRGVGYVAVDENTAGGAAIAERLTASGCKVQCPLRSGRSV